MNDDEVRAQIKPEFDKIHKTTLVNNGIKEINKRGSL